MANIEKSRYQNDQVITEGSSCYLENIYIYICTSSGVLQGSIIGLLLFIVQSKMPVQLSNIQRLQHVPVLVMFMALSILNEIKLRHTFLGTTHWPFTREGGFTFHFSSRINNFSLYFPRKQCFETNGASLQSNNVLRQMVLVSKARSWRSIFCLNILLQTVFHRFFCCGSSY